MNIIKALLVLLLILNACGGGGSDEGNASTSQACGVIGLPTKSVFNKVINGQACGNTNISPIVRVAGVIDHPTGLLALPFCTGSMISNDDVLTAGHCFFESQIGDFPIVAFGILIGDPENIEFFQARDIEIDPGLNQGSERLFNDAAILKLFDSPGISPLPVLLSSEPMNNQDGFVYGYGITETGVDSQADFVDLEAGAMTVREVTANHIFVVFNGAGVNVCNGDSGGPLVVDNGNGPGIVGIVSQGSVVGCQSGDVTTFTNVQQSGTMNWLTSQVGDLAVR